MGILEAFMPKDELRFNEDGSYRIRDDEFPMGGKPYCRKCGEPRFFEATKFGYPNFKVGCMCSCQTSVDRTNELLKIRQENERKFKEDQRLSVIGKNIDKTFDDYTVTDANKEIVRRFQAYCNNAEMALSKNVGFYLSGESRVGKTLLTSILCNELVKKGYKCLFTSISRLLAEIQSGWSGIGVKEPDILRKVESVDFLFLDDFGTELIGKERKVGGTFEENKTFAIIDARSRSGKPLIITSNYSVEQLQTKYNIDERIVKRINEMATRKVVLKALN